MKPPKRHPKYAAAVKAKCYDCIYDEKAAGAAIVQVELCTVYDCPLWDVRPCRPRREQANYPHGIGFSQHVLTYYELEREEAARIGADPYQRPDGAPLSSLPVENEHAHEPGA